MANRGQLTDRIQDLAQVLMGRNISQRELRMMPYVSFVVTNNKRPEREKMNHQDLDVLMKWQNQGWVVSIAPTLEITGVFWDIINQFIYVSYVNYENEQGQPFKETI